jgi:hypothetical protein
MKMRDNFVRVSAEIDGTKIIEENEENLVVPAILAREGIFPFKDHIGKTTLGYRPASELKNAAFTAEGAWVVSEKHIDTVFVEDAEAIQGRVEKTRWCSDINGIIGQIRWFKKACDPKFLDAVKAGTKKDVSFAYFCEKDIMPGEWSGQKYDFVQRKLMFGHLAAGIPEGRCPSPFCGMQLDAALKAMFDPEVTEDYIRIRVRDPGVFVDGSFRTIVLSAGEGIHAIIGKLKSDPQGATVIQNYMFERSKGWTMEKAQAWVDKHKEDSFEETKEPDKILPKEKVDPEKEIQRSRDLLSPYHLNDISKR